MGDLDTGDTIIYKPSKEVFMVACVHGEYIHTCGFPEQRLRKIDCGLLERANSSQRKAQLEMMASATSRGHRTMCARQRLAAD